MTVTGDYSQFDPHAYLQEYYADVGPENMALLRFLVETFRRVPAGALLLDFGGGPTLYADLVAAKYVREIHFSDYFEANLEEVRRWLREDPKAFDWGEFVRAILELEGGEISARAVAVREALTRARVTRVVRCDAKCSRPLGEIDWAYDVVMTNFCAEAAASDRNEWLQCMGHIVSLLKPGGRLVLSAVKGAQSYGVGEKTFLAVPLLEEDVRQMLITLGFVPESVVIESVPADRPERHYRGLIFATAALRPEARRERAERP